MIKHDSMRGYFAGCLYNAMIEDPTIYLICLDLGYRVFDQHFKDFSNRCINPGAAEQAGMGIAIGLALERKIPVVYSITTFLLYRPFEQIRTYINHEQIPVKLVGSGRDKDYVHDGFSHWSEDASYLFNYYGEGRNHIFGNIKALWPQTKEEIPNLMQDFLYDNKPNFLSLRR